MDIATPASSAIPFIYGRGLDLGHQKNAGFAAYDFSVRDTQIIGEDCQAQHPCVHFTVQPKCLAVCGETETCEYEVCMTYDFSVEGCSKSVGDTVSHTCEKPDNVCLDPVEDGTIGSSFANGLAVEIANIPSLYKQGPSRT